MSKGLPEKFVPLFLTRRQHEKLCWLAGRTGRPKSVILRELVEAGLSQPYQKEEEPHETTD